MLNFPVSSFGSTCERINTPGYFPWFYAVILVMSHLSQVPNKAIFSAKTSMVWNKKESSKWVIVRDLNDCDGKLPTPGRKGHGLQRKTFKPDGFFELFFYKKIALCQGVEWYVARTNQIAAFRYVSRTNQISALGYVSHTNQIAALGYVSRAQHLDILHQSRRLGYVSWTNHITAFGYLAPITAFKVLSRTSHITAFGYFVLIAAFDYCFHVNDVMESGGCAQRVTLTINFGLIW